jgi:hypothetical protein
MAIVACLLLLIYVNSNLKPKFFRKKFRIVFSRFASFRRSFCGGSFSNMLLLYASFCFSVENGITPGRSPVSGRCSTRTTKTNQHRSDTTVAGHQTSRNDRVGIDGGQHCKHRDTSRRHPVVSGGQRSTKQDSSHSTRCVPSSIRKH